MRIGQLADAVGINPRTIRFYEDIGLLPEPQRLPSGYRDYTEEDRARLIFVRTAQRLGLPLADITEIMAFKERGEAPCGYVRSVLARQLSELDERILELVALREQLRALQAIADDLPAPDDCYCSVIEHAATLEATAEKGPDSPTKQRNHSRSPRRP